MRVEKMFTFEKVRKQVEELKAFTDQYKLDKLYVPHVDKLIFLQRWFRHFLANPPSVRRMRNVRLYRMVMLLFDHVNKHLPERVCLN